MVCGMGRDLPINRRGCQTKLGPAWTPASRLFIAPGGAKNIENRQMSALDFEKKLNIVARLRIYGSLQADIREIILLKDSDSGEEK
ncbi:MAG: hypothetical protein HZA50_19370 [Planctomycetes bacterium]|nr:hypothetical protein [Planctomycetota bacterium]